MCVCTRICAQCVLWKHTWGGQRIICRNQFSFPLSGSTRWNLGCWQQAPLSLSCLTRSFKHIQCWMCWMCWCITVVPVFRRKRKRQKRLIWGPLGRHNKSIEPAWWEDTVSIFFLKGEVVEHVTCLLQNCETNVLDPTPIHVHPDWYGGPPVIPAFKR